MHAPPALGRPLRSKLSLLQRETGLVLLVLAIGLFLLAFRQIAEAVGAGDARAFDGTVTIQQPQIKPLWGGWSPHELLAVFSGETRPDGYAILRAAWMDYFQEKGDAEELWANALRIGLVPDSAAAPASVSPVSDLASRLPPAPARPDGGALTALFINLSTTGLMALAWNGAVAWGVWASGHCSRRARPTRRVGR